MPKIRRFEDFHPKLRKRKRLPVGWFLSASFAILFFGRLLKLITGSDSMEFTNLDIATPIGSGVLSPIVFVCCQNLFGREGNQGQLSRRLPRWYKTMPEKIPVDVRYMNAPCFNRRELEGVNPQEHGGDWPIHKSFPAENLQIFRQRIDEIHKQGGIVLAEGNCKIPRTELANVWLESMIDNETGINGTVSQRILDKFSLQDKKRLRLVLMKYGYEKYTPKHYFNTTADLEFPLVLKREKAEGGVGTYIVNSLQELEKRMSEDDRFEGMGTRHKKSRHRTIGSGWLLEEFLKGR